MRMNLRYVLLFGLICGFCSLNAEQSNTQNPFEIRAISANQGAQLVNPNNPFEKGYYDTFQHPTTQLERLSTSVKKLSHMALLIYNSVLLILLTLALTYFKPEFQRNMRAIGSLNVFKIQYRDLKEILSQPQLFFYVLFFLSGGLFLFMTMRQFGTNVFSNEGLNLGFSVFALAAIVLLKLLVLSTLAVIFPFRKELEMWNYYIGISYGMLGILLIPCVLILSFVPPQFSKVIWYGFLILLGLFFLHRTFRGLGIATNYPGFSKLHLLLYFCAIEIAPALVVIKLFLMIGQQ